MQFHFEKTLEKRYEPQVTVTNETPAWLMICLAGVHKGLDRPESQNLL